MARQVEALNQVLLKIQSTFGTAESSLTASDVAEVERGAKASYAPKVTDISLVGAGFTQNKSVIGPRECSISLAYPLRTGGAENSPGQAVKALQCCGWKETASDTDADATNDRFAYTPSNKQSEWKDCTVWAYSGNLDTSGSYLRKIQNVMFSGKLSIDFETCVAKLMVEGKGALNTEDAAATQATVTPSSTAVASLAGATINFFGDADYTLINLEYDFGEAPNTSINGANANGLGMTTQTDRKIKFTAKVYKDTAIAPVTALNAGTLGTISVMWGTVPNKFTVATGSSKAQITSVSESEQNGYTTYDISGIVIDNDLTITVDTAA